MSQIRVVWGTATGPTAMASYDAALAEANVHNFNLITVSSVIPAEPTVEAVGTAPDLGPAGEALTVVESRATVAPDDDSDPCAGVGWTRSESGRGLFYECSGSDVEVVSAAIEDGLDAGRDLRDWSFHDDERVVVEHTEGSSDAYTTVVVLAVYGDSWPLL
ncbi:pyruvoyl-dependent arginine decarboxylase [Haloarculaceae archaeon H-GB2-1]|nr:pyruvoyl-dependent arginine decarboxylase [Haloarculaceae archaeon H-GB1-1]MEA5385676.1 pyruvoyl-dependent arginine decarboxylase [Haloarculaceae archaeon H-GB11]MEA5407177.1 pyruvoyl-dependent arginine decarboxylase [Haloarculaceae archaeon H-GB2-1]